MRLTILTVLGAILAVVGGFLLDIPLIPTGSPRRTTELLSPPPQEVEVIERRTRVKNQLAQRVIAERVPLLEAAELFRQVNGEDGMEALIRTTSGRSVREKLCRQVIDFVRAAEREKTQEGYVPTGPLTSNELQAELDRLLAAGAFSPEPDAR